MPNARPKQAAACWLAELGTRYMVDHMKKMYAWDWASRQGNVNTKGFVTEVHEFDYKETNEMFGTDYPTPD